MTGFSFAPKQFCATKDGSDGAGEWAGASL